MAVVPSFPPLLGYIPREHLASGGQSAVYRALNPSTDHLAAIKVVPLRVPAGTAQGGTAAMDPAVAAKAKQLVREMRIHETLHHRNILRLFGGETRDECTVRATSGGETTWPSGLYMVLDLADGGDLFDKITPDVGVDTDIAHLYFRQLISGLKYLNQHGICHRDVKPENCLLDGHGNLKVSDFGLATVFKYKGQERLLKDRCGSPPYAAPELARPQPYAAEPIDVWSAGVLLFALLFGNTPWDEPTPNSPEFASYVAGTIFTQEPWRRLGSARESGVAQLLLAMLTVDPERRPRLKDVERMDWYCQSNPLLDLSTGLVADPHELLRRLLATLHAHEYLGPPAEEFEELMSASQAASSQYPAMSQKMSQRGLDPNQSFRSSLQLYSRLSIAPTQRTNPNLTRFFTTQPLPVLLSVLTRALSALSLNPYTPSTPAFELLYSSPSPSSAAKESTSPPSVEAISSTPLGTLLARVRIRTRDKRAQKLWLAILVSKSVLPPDPASSSSGGGGMDVDGAEQEGLDVVCWKREADPLEMKRLWRSVVERLPEGVVVAM
ncbi:Chk1 protein kinase [Rhodotorula kratochvilovae]